ncbi:hypothetical protein TSUD_240990 [Trifolium subterraneum]|uniref:Uncharacterized protein n=1 Tax=Trifolium subterraneum TaxID=3900 RepID=A0A2Z6NJB2_TRISU|nr:hypothetical protein TSUD_240990 [Trifolium subterraneum]
MVIIRELTDDTGGCHTPPLSGSELMSQIRHHFTRANGSLNERGFYSKVFGFPVSSSDSEDSSETGSTSTSSGVKRKKRTLVKAASKVSKKDGGSSSQVVSADASLGNDVVLDKSSPQRVLRPRQKGVASDSSLNDAGGSVPDAHTAPTVVSGGIVSPEDVGEAAWSESFDPIEFMDQQFLVRGDPSRFAFVPTADLRRKALNCGVRGLMLTHLLADRQEREVISERARADRVEKTVEDMESRYTNVKAKLQKEIDDLQSSRDEAVKLGKKKEDAMVQLKVTHAGEFDRLKKTYDFDQALWRRRISGECTLRDALIISCVQAGKDMMALQDFADELEATNNALKEGMADKYLDGFTLDVEQFKVVFLDLDPELVSQIDVMKKVEGGKLVSRVLSAAYNSASAPFEAAV